MTAWILQGLALVWAVSAALCWEAHGKALLANDGYWMQRTLRSLCPVFNTMVAWRHCKHSWRKR
jgi:hypothetical protein